MNFRQQRKYPFRLVYQLITVLLLMSVGPLFLSSRKLMDINQKTIEGIILDLHTQAAGRLKNSVETFLHNVKKSLSEIAQLQGMTDVLESEQRQSLLVNFLSSNDHIAGIKLYSRDGRELLSASRDQALNESFGVFAGMRRGMEAVNDGSYYVGQPLSVQEYDSVLLPVMVPVKSSQGENQAVLAALVDLREVQEIVSAARVGRHGSAFMVDGTGRVIAHQDDAKVRERTDLNDLEIVGSYVLTGRTGGTIPFLEEDGRQMLGAYDLVEDVGWGVVIEEPKDDAYLSLKEMRSQTTIWVVLVSLAALVLAVLSSHRISKPIRVFASRALDVARGDFRGSILINSRNEIGQLAETFNFMMRELDIYDRNMRDLYLSTIKSLAAAVDAKDPYTRGHSERVTYYSMAICKEMGIKDRQLEEVQIAALLHDVGKIGIDDAILRKPGRLLEEEYAIIKMHPVFGANIMSPIKQLRDILPGMKYHHEQFNGSGYPEGLLKDEIPLMARIISVADSFDAMTSDRPYQKAMDDKQAMKTLQRLAGIRYDPEVVASFIKAYPGLNREKIDESIDEFAETVTALGEEEGI